MSDCPTCARLRYENEQLQHSLNRARARMNELGEERDAWHDKADELEAELIQNEGSVI